MFVLNLIIVADVTINSIAIIYGNKQKIIVKNNSINVSDIRKFSEKLISKHLDSSWKLKIEDIESIKQQSNKDEIETVGLTTYSSKTISLNIKYISEYPHIRIWKSVILHEIAHAKLINRNVLSHGLTWKWEAFKLRTLPTANINISSYIIIK